MRYRIAVWLYRLAHRIDSNVALGTITVVRTEQGTKPGERFVMTAFTGVSAIDWPDTSTGTLAKRVAS
jgi:hypothetical protein